MRLSQLQAMDPIAFEKYVGTLFAKRGYRVQDTQASADEGIDLIVRQGRRMAVVQCKRYQGSVGQPVVRDLYGVMLHTRADEAYLVTTGTVTTAARRWSEGKPIHLVDQHRLVEWARTGRLNYERPSALKGPNRPRQFLVGLILLAIVAAALLAPDRMLAVRDGLAQAAQPLLTRLEASVPLPGTATQPSPTAPATPDSIPASAPDNTSDNTPDSGPDSINADAPSQSATETPNAGRVPKPTPTPIPDSSIDTPVPANE